MNQAKRINQMKLLLAIKEGRKHTRANTVLAPLAQAYILSYTLPPKGWPAENIKLTSNGEIHLDFWMKELGLTPEDLR